MMRFSVFRGFLFGCLALAAALFSIAAVPVAKAGAVFEISDFDHSFILRDEAATAAVAPDGDLAAPGEIRRYANMRTPAPVYALSERTDGHSLAGFRWRC